MIDRYTTPEMRTVWSDQYKLEAWKRVELEHYRALAYRTGLSPEEAQEALQEICLATANTTLEEVQKRERETQHDLAAFVDVVTDQLPQKIGRWFHYGLTSSDVVDTALALQLKQAGYFLMDAMVGLSKTVGKLAHEHTLTLCLGRTHGMAAEQTTFGHKMYGFQAEIDRNIERLGAAFEGARIGTISGPVGTYPVTDREHENRVLDALGLLYEDVPTQIVARDRHAEVLTAIAITGAGLERLATEIRHLQRSEVAEVQEPFQSGQKGSSAMPHKRNPIKSEKVCGIARLLRGYATAGIENIALWHERDMSHSSVERIVLPDATTLLHHAILTMTEVIGQLEVDPDRMHVLLEDYGDDSHARLNTLMQDGLTRDEAYRKIQG